jgi:hypothetical protein
MLKKVTCTNEVSTVTLGERDFMTIDSGGTKTHENISHSFKGNVCPLWVYSS